MRARPLAWVISPAATPAASRLYQVWHDYGWPERRLLNLLNSEATPFPEGFTHVGNVRAGSLAEALELSVDKGRALSASRRFTVYAVGVDL